MVSLPLVSSGKPDLAAQAIKIDEIAITGAPHPLWLTLGSPLYTILLMHDSEARKPAFE